MSDPPESSEKRAASHQSAKVQFFADGFEWDFTLLFLPRSTPCCSGVSHAVARGGQAGMSACTAAGCCVAAGTASHLPTVTAVGDQPVCAWGLAYLWCHTAFWGLDRLGVGSSMAVAAVTHDEDVPWEGQP